MHSSPCRFQSSASLSMEKSTWLPQAVWLQFDVENFHRKLSSVLRHGDLQDEHKFFPWLQTFITRKLRGIQTYFFLPLLKL